MDLERNLSAALDDPEPAWGDEDAMPRAESLWLARARAFGARTEPHDVVAPPHEQERPEPAPAVAAAAEPAAEEPAADEALWFAPSIELATEDDPVDLADDVNRAGDGIPCDEPTWFTTPEFAPGTADALVPAGVATDGAAPLEFPPAWFPAPVAVDDDAPVAESPGSEGHADVLSAALARFEAGQSLVSGEPRPVADEPSLEPDRDVHAWFPSSKAFLDTLSAEAAAVLDKRPAPVVLVDAQEGGAPPASEPDAIDGEHPLVVEMLDVEEGAVDVAPATDAATLVERPVEAPPVDVLPAVARWRASQEASLEAWVAAATRTIEGWPAGAATVAGDVPCADAAPDVEACEVVEAGLKPGPTPEAGLKPCPTPEAGLKPCPTPEMEGEPVAAVVPASPVVAPPPVVPIKRSWKPRRVTGLVAACLAGIAVVATMLVPKLSTPHAPRVVAPPVAVAPVAAPVEAPRVVAVAAVTRPASAWHETSEWTGGRKKSIAFEMAAEEPVRLWMRHIRPVLVVRCLGGTLDAFVVTQSASAIEPGRTDHTVRLAFDEGLVAVERWVDSAERDGLFAPDGRAVVERAASSGRLRFTFTPHNAPPAEASFRLAGIESLQAPLMKHCK
jgi:hypothetical protein